MQWPKRTCSVRSNISQPEFINGPTGVFRDDKFRAGTNDAQRRIATALGTPDPLVGLQCLRDRIAAPASLADYGFKDVNHVWYRLHVLTPPSQQSLALLMRAFGGSFRIFVNGVEAKANRDNNQLEGTVRSPFPLRIGRRERNNQLHNVAVQDVRIHRGRLSRAEVRAIAAARCEAERPGMFFATHSHSRSISIDWPSQTTSS